MSSLSAGPAEDNHVAICDDCDRDDGKYLGGTRKFKASAQADASRHDESAHGHSETPYVVEVDDDGGDGE